MRIFALSLGFAPARIFIETFNAFYKSLTGIKPQLHYVLNNRYPVNEDQNNALLETYCHIHPIMEYYDAGHNLGLSGGYNKLLSMLAADVGLEDDDIIVYLDPDVNIITPGWLDAAKTVFENNKYVGWVSLYNERVDEEFKHRPYVDYEVAGVRVREPSQPMINSVCIFRYSYLKAMNGLNEDGLYGGLECKMWNLMSGKGYRWIFLRDFHESCGDDKFKADRAYTVYKWEYAHTRSTKLDFKSWLEEDPKRLELK